MWLISECSLSACVNLNHKLSLLMGNNEKSKSCVALQEMKRKLSSSTEMPWVLHFDKGPMDNLEIRKLPAFTSDINVSWVPFTLTK